MSLASWIYTLLVASFVTSIILYVLSSNPKAWVVKVGCACVMYLVLLSSISSVSLDTFFDFSNTEGICFKELSDDLVMQVIQDKTEEYIESEAVRFGMNDLSAEVEVAKNEEGNYALQKIIVNTENLVSQDFYQHVKDDLGIVITQRSNNDGTTCE